MPVADDSLKPSYPMLSIRAGACDNFIAALIVSPRIGIAAITRPAQVFHCTDRLCWSCEITASMEWRDDASEHEAGAHASAGRDAVHLNVGRPVRRTTRTMTVARTA